MSACKHVLFSDGENHTLAEAEARLVDLEDDEAIAKLPAILFIGVVLLIGFCGNLLVCAVYHLKFIASTSKYFIVTLAIFDLLNCTIAIPAEMVDLRYDYHFNSPDVCRIMRFTITFNTAASAGTLLAIAVDRYRRICRPFEKQMTLRETKLWIAFAVFGSLLLSWPATLLYGKQTEMIEGVETADCSFDDSVKDTCYPRVYIVVLTVLCLASIGVLIALYVLIVLKVWRQRKARKRIISNNVPKSPSASLARKLNCLGVKGEPEVSRLSGEADLSTDGLDIKRKSNGNQSQSIKTTLMLLCVTAVFIVSFIPYFTLQIIKSALPQFEDDLHCNHSAMVAYKLFLRSFFINSAVNPIIYSFCNEKFRLECKLLVSCLFCVNCDGCCQRSDNQFQDGDFPTRFRNIEAVLD